MKENRDRILTSLYLNNITLNQFVLSLLVVSHHFWLVRLGCDTSFYNIHFYPAVLLVKLKL